MNRPRTAVMVSMGIAALAAVGVAAWFKYGWTTETAYIQIVQVEPTGIHPAWTTAGVLAVVIIGLLLYRRKRRHA